MGWERHGGESPHNAAISILPAALREPSSDLRSGGFFRRQKGLPERRDADPEALRFPVLNVE
jgi:hypothetical protein